MAIKEENLKKPEQKHGLKGAALFNDYRIDKEILKAMDEDTYEEFVTSWAYWCLKESGDSKYEDVFRLGGSGDGGIDVIAYHNVSTRECDIYQCKHYDHPVNRTDVIAELGKFLYHVYKGEIPRPQRYYLMAPQGLSGQFNKIYTDNNKLKDELLKSWEKDVAKNIESKKTISLDDGLRKFLQDFDYSKFELVSPDKIIKDVYKRENRHVYFTYFGVRKDDIERISITPPANMEDYEKSYIQHLMDAYSDVDEKELVTTDNIGDTVYASHFERSRDQFWMAESIKKLSEENSPGDTDEFRELEKDVLQHVADVYEENHDNAYEKVKAVTKEATTMPKKENRVISGELGGGELRGVCYQLSNNNELIWKKEKS